MSPQTITPPRIPPLPSRDLITASRDPTPSTPTSPWRFDLLYRTPNGTDAIAHHALLRSESAPPPYSEVDEM